MPPRKAAPAAMIPTKASFFMRKRDMETRTFEKKPNTDNKGMHFGGSSARISQVADKTQKRRFLFDKETNDAYAEIMGDSAICLDTGMELFRFAGGEGNYPGFFEQDVPSRFEHTREFDFTPPDGKRHPGERFVDVTNLVKAGLLSEEDVASHKAFSDEELKGLMHELGDFFSDEESVLP